VSCRIIELAERPEPVGRAVCSIGVFDGVHTGHATLVRDAVLLAARLGVEAYAVTFDRDPDQVVTPDSAAPQLLTLAEKAELLCDLGVNAVLVVPFDSRVASLAPSEFFSDVLLAAVDPVAIVVGEDFRFGHRAQGDVDLLRALARPRGVDVVAHALVTAEGEPVTSTRIRALVARGRVAEAGRLLGRPHRVAGTVVRGRGEGAAIGVPTANVDPVPFAALPAPGVYAGRARVGLDRWPAAISAGRPPSFVEATAELEVHLIGFEGDLYGRALSVEFLDRLRDQRRFESAEDLLRAMRSDIADAERIAALIPDWAAEATAEKDRWDENPLTSIAGRLADAFSLGATEDRRELLDDGSPVVEDPAALAAAERAVAHSDPDEAYADFDDSWVQVLGPVTLVNVTARIRSFEITSPLIAEGIPFAWDPLPPEELSTVRPELANAQRFRLYVAPQHAERARELVAWWDEGAG